MARVISLSRAVELHRRVLFDTNILICAFKQRDRGPLQDLIVQVPLNRRFTMELAYWEFLQSKDFKSREVRDRVHWLKNTSIQVEFGRPVGFVDAFRTWVEREGPRGSAVDATLAICSISSKESVAIATENGRDFCWHPKIEVIREFLEWRSSLRPESCHGTIR